MPVLPLLNFAPPGDAAPFDHADAAMVLEPATGVWDVSYASAWQLGRLLALASPSFAKELLVIRHDYAKQAWSASAIEQYVYDNAPSIDDQRKTQGADPTHPFSSGNGTGITETAGAIGLVEWLARLALLYPVPFHYQVSDEALLPDESLRFFHVDGNWVEALIEGALSIGVHCSLDREANQSHRAALRTAVSKMIGQYRGWLRDWKGHQTTPTNQIDTNPNFLTQPLSGFLLRSVLVDGWPGIEIDVTGTITDEAGTPTPNQPLPLLRWDHLGSGVLFCLAAGTVTKVTIRQPREHLTMGLDADAIMLRQVSGSIGQPVKSAGKEEKIEQVQSVYALEGGKPGVLDITRLATTLQSKAAVSPPNPSPNYPVYSPAAFALQLTRSPEDQVIEWKA